MEEWKDFALKDFMSFNPKVLLKKNTLAKKITMDSLTPNSRDIHVWVVEPYSGGTKFQNGDTIMARITPCLENGKHAFVSCLDDNEIAYGSTEYFVFRGIPEISDNKFVYYLTHTELFKNTAIKSMVGSSGRQRAQVEVLKELHMLLPDMDAQSRIVDILSNIDDKIELNGQINHNLEQQAMALYRLWFESDYDGDWQIKKLSDFFDVRTGKKDANYASPKGKYPFFTCGQDVLSASDYTFDGAAILLAGSGDFNVKRYIGKFEAYQRTYVLIPFDVKYHTFLFLKIKSHLADITGGSRGSVIKFITKGNIADYEFMFPRFCIDEKLKILDVLYKEIDLNCRQIRQLEELRDTLLPKLMSGELKVGDVEM